MPNIYVDVDVDVEPRPKGRAPKEPPLQTMCSSSPEVSNQVGRLRREQKLPPMHESTGTTRYALVSETPISAIRNPGAPADDQHEIG